ncbi:unnamed protein product [Cladocopium goreaui]|uniref:Uncharacterized protein n=1 Tax=Cladocopium goreaui TaxID=2562237 RepID=A0A9P1CAX3_9DINO|nr:unnamed protein product [Cladocopium goreaui]
MDKFLERALQTEVKQKEFFAFIEDTQHSLAQLILLNGFLTDPNTPGVEKIVACPMLNAWLAAPVAAVKAIDFGAASDMMDPGYVFLVKGWNRCVSMMTVLYACFDKAELLSFGTVYATAVQPDGNNVVNTNRGVTLAGNLRRRPNAFNILHQLEFLERTGLSQDLSIRALEAHESMSKFASAYALGEKESKAAVNLLQHIPKLVKEGLIELVRFEMRHGDADLLQLLEESVPPADIARVAIFAQPLAKYQQEAALDFKYLNDRYQKGRDSIRAHMEEKLMFHRCSSLVLAHSHIVEAQSKMGADGLTILVGDCTLWPARCLDKHCSTNVVVTFFGSNMSRILVIPFLIRVLDIYEIAVNFNDAQHQGDKRKRSQQCLAGVSGHTTVAFSKSKALMGTIANVPRARVQDLSNPDPDRPLSPHFRAQQRGVEATKFILEQLLDGMHATSKQPVLIVDMMPTRIPEMVVTKYQASHAEPLKALQDKISQETNIQTAIKTHTMSSAAAASGGVTRTLASPDWDGNPPWNWLEGCATLARDPDLQVVVTSLNSVWVVNRGTSAKELAAGELFGFNTDQCATQAGTVPWFVNDDRTLVCDTTSGSKTLNTLADVLCEVTKSRGVTEVRVVDHGLQPKMKVAGDGGQIPLAYRFKVAAGAKVNAFKPKDITEDKMALRSAMMGAMWNGRMSQLPRCSHADIIWEAGMVFQNIPLSDYPNIISLRLWYSLQPFHNTTSIRSILQWSSKIFPYQIIPILFP